MELVLMVGAALRFGLPGVLTVLVLKQAFTLVFMSRTVVKATPFVRLSVSALPLLKKYYSYGFIMFLTGLTAMSVEHSDKFFLGKIRGLDSLGVYSVSYGVCVFLADLAMPIFYILLPVVAAHVAEGQHEQARHYLERSFRALMLIYTPAVIFFSMEARDMLGVFTVREYFGGAVIFPWVASGIALFQINGIHMYALHAHRKGAQVLASLSLAAIVNLGMNFWLIPRYGIVGAALATFVAYLLHFVIMRHCANRCIRVRYGTGFLARLAVCGAGTGGAIYLVQQISAGYTVRLLAALALGGAAYVVLLTATNCVSADERRQLVELVKNSLSPDRGRT
jgi:O-antigen/teichoic acid export membrane protein